MEDKEQNQSDDNKAEHERKSVPGWVNFVIGGSAGMMSICIVQPADLVKTRMQLRGLDGKKTPTFNVIKEIFKSEGIFGFYRGLSAALFRQATYTTGRMGCFNTLFDYYNRYYGPPIYPMKMAMGLVSGGFGAFIGTPAEVALVRMTADGRLPPEKRRNYKNVFNALFRIVREEGVITLWSGTTVTITRAMVVNGVQLATYSQVRELLMPTLGSGFKLHICSSIISGLVTATISLPMDIIKTRVQTMGKDAHQLTILVSMIKNEGILSLWSGFLPTYARMGPHTIFTFFFIEELKNLYLKTASNSM